MPFYKVFSNVGTIMYNKDAYDALKAQYEMKGYTSKKSKYAALGCLSGRSQGHTCKWYVKNGQVVFERIT